MKTVVLILALTALAGAQTRPAPAFDPAGKWTFSTTNENGQPISGTMEITGRPGAYAGTILGADGQPLVITEGFTSPTGAVLFANLADGNVAVIKMVQDAAGKVDCKWGPLQAQIPATLARAK